MGSLDAENTAKQDLDDSGCVQDASEGENGSRGYPQLLDLSDDVLLCILQYLTPMDLKALGHTCPRLGALICDRTLWTKVDARTSPIGQERMKWLLTHCLSAATTELKIAGYANKYSRCLGIQDMHWPVEADQDFIRGTCIGSQEGVDVEHFLLRMWYPHLPRFAVSPRWPSKFEAEFKNAKAEADRKKAESEKKTVDASTSTSEEPSTSGENSAKPGNSAQEAGTSGQSAKVFGPNLHKPDLSDQSSGSFSPGMSSQDQNPSTSDPKSGQSELKEDFPFLFEDDFQDDCRGPQFTLTKKLMKDLNSICSNLTSLFIEYCNLDYKTTNLRHFPVQLKKLSLRGSRVYNLPLNTSYLGKVPERIPDLEYLDVSECDWFEPASLMPLSKLVALTELYMRDCNRLTECVAYASLATRYGFRKLRVFDVRGSPLADSEVSALGWLPRLEELYVSPPEDYNYMTEHTHSWCENSDAHCELDAWEEEEPDYYKTKSPEPEQDSDDKDDEADDRHGDTLFNNPWWSHDRRIIVIQPNANRQLEEHYPLMQRQPQNVAEENWPVPPRQGPRVPGPEEPPVDDAPLVPAGLPPIRYVPGSIDIVPDDLIHRHRMRQPLQPPMEPPSDGPVHPKPVPVDPRDDALLRPGTANPKPGVPPLGSKLSGPSNQQAGPAIHRPSLQLTHQRLGPGSQRTGPTNSQAGPSHSRPGPTNPQAGPSHPRPGPANPEAGPSRSGPANPQAGPSHSRPGPNPQAGPSHPRPGPANPEAGPSRPGPANPEAGPSRPGPANPEAGPSRSGPANAQPSTSNPGPSNAQPGPDAGEGTSKRRFNINIAIDLAKRRRVEGEEDEEMAPAELNQADLPLHDPEQCVRLQLRDVEDPEQPPAMMPRHPGCVRFRRHDLRPIMHIDVDINRQSTIHIGAHVGYHLVSDSALLRFGRAENENVNYVHIGRNGIHHGSVSGSRPDRSNLRILSVTGYRNITDRSLQHLVTAAPYLVHIDFSETNVTPRGVELFKAVRPECEVIFSEFNRLP